MYFVAFEVPSARPLADWPELSRNTDICLCLKSEPLVKATIFTDLQAQMGSTICLWSLSYKAKDSGGQVTFIGYLILDYLRSFLFGEVKGLCPPGRPRSNFSDVAVRDCQNCRTGKPYRNAQDDCFGETRLVLYILSSS